MKTLVVAAVVVLQGVHERLRVAPPARVFEDVQWRRRQRLEATRSAARGRGGGGRRCVILSVRPILTAW